MSHQKSEPFDTPERAVIPQITQGHVAAMEASADGEPEAVWVMYNMSHLLLRMRGRKSGAVRKVALPYWNDDQGHPIVVASYAGSPKHPGWYLNLIDRDVNPELYVKTRFDQYWTEAEVLEGEERSRIWDALIQDRSYYADYQKLTERQLPLIRLASKRPADGPPQD